MKKLETRTIDVYDAGDGYSVEIIKSGKLAEAWLAHDDYGIKMLMIGMELNDFDNFIELVEAHLAEYEVAYMDECEPEQED